MYLELIGINDLIWAPPTKGWYDGSGRSSSSQDIEFPSQLDLVFRWQIDSGVKRKWVHDKTVSFGVNYDVKLLKTT